MYDRGFRLDNSTVFAFLLAVTLPYGNITKIIGVEDGFSRLIIPLLVLIFLLSELQKKRISFRLNSELYILLAALFVGMIGYMRDEIGLTELIGYFVKVAVLTTVYTYIVRYDELGLLILKKYHSIFLWSLCFSIPLWLIYPVPEFVFYDGNEKRFGGLHFELFNFCFSLCIFYVSWIFSGKNNFLGLTIFLMLGYFSGSNMFPLFALVFLIPNKILGIFKYRFVSCMGVLIIFFTPVGIGIFLNSLDFLMNLGLREQSQFDTEGSSIYVRLFPFYLATNYMQSLDYLGLFPTALATLKVQIS